MTSPTQIAARCGFFLVALLACLAVFSPRLAARGGSQDACVRWTQRYLSIGNDLQSRRFILEPKGDLELMPVFRTAEGRSIFHRPYSLLLDVGGRVQLFMGNAPGTCLLARDDDRSAAMEVPVFFVGRQGGSIEELKDNAERLVFDPSAPLNVGSDFSEISFHLRRGGSRFGEIRPFFLCGLAGLLVCEESCPQDSTTLAASLVNEIVRGESFPASGRDTVYAPPTMGRTLRRSGPPPALTPRFSQAPSEPPPALEPAPMPPPREHPAESAAPPAKPECPACPPPPQHPENTVSPQEPAAASSPPPPGQPSTPAALPPKEAAPPTQPSKTETPPPKVEAAPPAPPPAKPSEPAPPLPKAEPAPPPRAEPPENAAVPPKAPAPAPQVEPAPQPKAPAPAPAQHLVLAFERKNGEALPAADVLQAEGGLGIEGVPLQAGSEGLTADLPADAAKKAGDVAYLKNLLRRHQLVNLKKEAERLVLVVDPLYARAEDLKIEIRDAAGDPVRGCNLKLDVSANRRLGDGWAKTGEKEQQGLEYAESDGYYGLNLPVDVEPNELLISTAEPGNVARLSNPGHECQLENRPWVQAEEIRTGRIVRSLQRTGQTLIAVFSTDSTFAGLVTPAGAEGFWSDALRLVNVASTAAWEKKVLARAQAPGVSPDTVKLQSEGQGAALAGDGDRGAILKILSAGSQDTTTPASVFPVQPIDQYILDIALKLIREEASISLRYSVKQEALLLVTGSLREAGNSFCQNSPWSSLQWVKQARKIFALEVWSAGAVAAMQLRVKPALNAPDGVYICNIQSPEGDKIALYGILPKVVSDLNARAKAFSYLTGQANSFLKP